jgi:hypothetical protein
MKLRTMLSSIALVSALSLSGGAFAQAMLGEMAIPTENLGDFQEKCAAIASAATESLSEPVNSDATDDTATGTVDSANASDSPDQANDDNLDQLLASMTPEQCKEAGLLPGGPNAANAATQ